MEPTLKLFLRIRSKAYNESLHINSFLRSNNEMQRRRKIKRLAVKVTKLPKVT